MREGAALLQGIAKCGCCGRGLRVYYRGRNSAPGYYCAGNTISNGRGERCLQIGGPADRRCRGRELFSPRWHQPASRHTLKAAEQMESDHDGVLAQFKRVKWNARDIKHSGPSYAAIVRSIPKTRLVARGLEAEWEQSLHQCKPPAPKIDSPRAAAASRVEAQKASRNSISTRPVMISRGVWSAPTTRRSRSQEIAARFA